MRFALEPPLPRSEYLPNRVGDHDILPRMDHQHRGGSRGEDGVGGDRVHVLRQLRH